MRIGTDEQRLRPWDHAGAPDIDDAGPGGVGAEDKGTAAPNDQMKFATYMRDSVVVGDSELAPNDVVGVYSADVDVTSIRRNSLRLTQGWPD